MGSDLVTPGLLVNSALKKPPASLGATVSRQVAMALLARAPRQSHSLMGDLLPVPLGLSAEDMAAIDKLVTSPEMRSVESEAVMELGITDWLGSVVPVLDFMKTMPRSAAVLDDGFPDWPRLSRYMPRASQRRALERLTDQI